MNFAIYYCRFAIHSRVILHIDGLVQNCCKSFTFVKEIQYRNTISLHQAIEVMTVVLEL